MQDPTMTDHDINGPSSRVDTDGPYNDRPQIDIL